MTVGFLNHSILSVHYKFRPLVLAYTSSIVDCVLLFIEMLDGFLTTTFFNIPSTI